MEKPRNRSVDFDAMVEDFRHRARMMLALPPKSVGTGEMRVKASQMMRLLDELDRLKCTTQIDAAPQKDKSR